jgi:carbon storage regulator
MLVLTRRQNEQIVIDENIVVTVVSIRGDKLRFGIQAPKEVPVHRREVYEAMKREQLQKEASRKNLGQH